MASASKKAGVALQQRAAFAFERGEEVAGVEAVEAASQVVTGGGEIKRRADGGSRADDQWLAAGPGCPATGAGRCRRGRRRRRSAARVEGGRAFDRNSWRALTRRGRPCA